MTAKFLWAFSACMWTLGGLIQALAHNYAWVAIYLSMAALCICLTQMMGN